MIFENLETTKFSEKISPYCEEIYKSIFFPDKIINTFNTKLDTDHGIDYVLIKNNKKITIQQKIRKQEYMDIYGKQLCIEIKNGNNKMAEYEYLKADFYANFYANGDKIIDFAIIYIPKLKEIIEQNGGIIYMGGIQKNNNHGKSKFVSIDYCLIKEAIAYENHPLSYP
jgi:hypothetical protein